MKLPRRKFLHLAVGAAAMPAVPNIARALDYPSRPVRLFVGFAEANYPARGPNHHQRSHGAVCERFLRRLCKRAADDEFGHEQ